MADDSVFPAPANNPESTHFYQEAASGRFMIRRCGTCHKAHWYPRTRCPFCFGATSWEPASGKGTLYSFSSMFDGTRTKTIAYVTLEEGPSMMTNIVDCDPATLEIGQAMRLVFKESSNPSEPIACFRPA